MNSIDKQKNQTIILEANQTSKNWVLEVVRSQPDILSAVKKDLDLIVVNNYSNN